MSADLSAAEQSALESFRAGDPVPLKSLTPERLQLVMRRMSRDELLQLGMVRQRTCRHGTTEVQGSVETSAGKQLVLHCLDCGLVFERPE